MARRYTKEYWRGFHDCELGKPYKVNETEDWMLGYTTALEDGFANAITNNEKDDKNDGKTN